MCMIENISNFLVLPQKKISPILKKYCDLYVEITVRSIKRNTYNTYQRYRDTDDTDHTDKTIIPKEDIPEDIRRLKVLKVEIIEVQNSGSYILSRIFSCIYKLLFFTEKETFTNWGRLEQINISVVNMINQNLMENNPKQENFIYPDEVLLPGYA